MNERKKVYLSQLEGIQILWPGDVRALAEFVLRCCDARDKIANAQKKEIQKSRPTIHGLAMHFAGITGVPRQHIEQRFKSAGLSLAANVEFDSAPNTPTDR